MSNSDTDDSVDSVADHPSDATTDELTGIVLAGGYSRRFGDRDKATARLGGRPLLARVVSRLDAVADRVVVNCRADQRDRFERAVESAALSSPVTFVADPVPDRGPLFGFRTALRAVETETCVLTTCDAPFLDPRLVSDLVERVDSADADAAAIRTADGHCHPTQAVYRTARAEAVCDALLGADRRRLTALFDRLDHCAVPADEVPGDAARSLFDVDTPEDRERAAEMLAEREPKSVLQF